MQRATGFSFPVVFVVCISFPLPTVSLFLRSTTTNTLADNAQRSMQSTGPPRVGMVAFFQARLFLVLQETLAIFLAPASDFLHMPYADSRLTSTLSMRNIHFRRIKCGLQTKISSAHLTADIMRTQLSRSTNKVMQAEQHKLTPPAATLAMAGLSQNDTA
ncbi:hypothetical protein C8F04DRAFT_301664 [Mycena alexandri]|uniref:Uncharacterized protein n=1 Tax=Mycena alexandri TaxID=1745969 RepID=A0AAD6S3H9_9AGAR|nr:hypothetical protein C8F04DRAFT_301664 [Mycena alexandri]